MNKPSPAPVTRKQFNVIVRVSDLPETVIGLQTGGKRVVQDDNLHESYESSITPSGRCMVIYE